MKDEILDFDGEKFQSEEHAIKSFRQFLISSGCMLLTMVTLLFIGMGPAFLILTFGLVIFINSIWGLINGIRSFVNKENAIFKKYVGTIGNAIFLLYFLFLLFSRLFSSAPPVPT